MYAPEQTILSRTMPAQSMTEQMDELVRQHAGFVYRIAYACLRHRQEAEDAVQETFIRVWKHVRTLPEIGNQRAWLARIAWRVARDWQRGHSRAAMDGDCELAEIESEKTSVEEDIAQAQQAALLERMMALLPPDLRETLQLATVKEMTSPEIAEVLGIPEASVRGRLLRARRLLREKVQILMNGKREHGVRV